MANQQAGWYADPSGDVSKLRYWNGAAWTNDFTDAPQSMQQAAQSAESAAAEPQQTATPAEPQQSAQPAEPQQTSAPAEPQQVSAPAEPQQPFAPAEPQQAAAQAESQQAPAPVEPQQSAPAQSGQPFAPAQPQPAYTPAEPQQPFAPAQPQQTFTPEQTPQQPIPVESEQQYTPAEPLQPAATPQPGQPYPVPQSQSQPQVGQPYPAPQPQVQPQPQPQPGQPYPAPQPGQPGQPYAAPQPQQPYPPTQPQQPYPPVQGNQQPQKKKSKAPLIIGIIVGVLVLGGIITGLILMFGNQANDPVDPPVIDAPSEETEDTTDSDDVTPAVEGEVLGEIGESYETKWFAFTIESIKTDTTYAEYTAADGNILVIAHITETNISGSEQPFGTFDWIVTGKSLDEDIYPLDPINDKMMPKRFTMQDDESASYDVVFEYPKDLAEPCIMYVEVDDSGATYASFKFEIK